jgi:hypothetical protein
MVTAKVPDVSQLGFFQAWPVPRGMSVSRLGISPT